MSRSTRRRLTNQARRANETERKKAFEKNVNNYCPEQRPENERQKEEDRDSPKNIIDFMFVPIKHVKKRVKQKQLQSSMKSPHFRVGTRLAGWRGERWRCLSHRSGVGWWDNKAIIRSEIAVISTDAQQPKVTSNPSRCRIYSRRSEERRERDRQQYFDSFMSRH